MPHHLFGVVFYLFSGFSEHLLTFVKRLNIWNFRIFGLESGTVYTGVCIDTACSMGFCAEHAAAAAMITAGESRFLKMIAVGWDGQILPPCGRCREFISQIHDENTQTKFMVREGLVVTLKELLPFDWREAINE